MKTIRAKFNCSTVKKDTVSENITLHAVYGTDDKDNEENNQFSQATPFGELQMTIDNPTAQGFFKEGNNYYLDFTAAE
jgi:hypothetical protein